MTYCYIDYIVNFIPILFTNAFSAAAFQEILGKKWQDFYVTQTRDLSGIIPAERSTHLSTAIAVSVKTET